MAGYPPTPSFGISWGNGTVSGPQHENYPLQAPLNDVYNFDTAMEQNSNALAFQQNEGVPALNTSALTSAIQAPQSYGSYDHYSSLYDSTPEIPQIAKQNVEEGELSEGEFQDSPPQATHPVKSRPENSKTSPLSQPLTDAYGRSLEQRQRSESSDDYEPAFDLDPSHLMSRGNDVANSQPVTKSLEDARKDAQSAILNLLPMKVRFQNYVDEGIDPDVVRRQFEAIGLPQNWSGQGASAAKLSPVLDSIRTSTTQAPNVEERKDRIARLLAEKTRKLTATAQVQSSAATAAQNSAKAEKERMLRLKMEALQKSREQRAQKAATKSQIPLPTSPTNTSTTTAVVMQDTLASAPQPTNLSVAPSTPQQVGAKDPVGVKAAAPGIPGLFLSGVANMPASFSTSEIAATVGLNHRKRPVASDFDSLSSSIPAYKRPFGQNRNNQTLVIDVSDDESEDDGLDDTEAGYASSHVNQPSGAFQNGFGPSKLSGIRDLPPLSDFPARKPFNTPSSAVSTPPPTQNHVKNYASKPEDLLRKELEIQEMKRKIAEAERRKRAKQASSGSQTPGQDETKSSPMKPTVAVNIPNAVETSIQIERLLGDASRQVNDDQQRLAQNYTIEQTKSEELKKAEADQRRLRRAKIASDLPAVDAEVEKSRKRLADLRAEMAQLEAAVQQGLNQKQMLAEEMERLGQEAEEQLQVQKDKLDNLRREEDNSTEATPQPSVITIEPPQASNISDDSPTINEASNTLGIDLHDDVEDHRDVGPEIEHVPAPSASLDSGVDTSPSDPDAAEADEDVEMDEDSDSESSSDDNENRPDNRAPSIPGINPDQPFRAAAEQSSPGADVHPDAEANADVDALTDADMDADRDADMDDFYASDPREQAPTPASPSLDHNDQHILVADNNKAANTADAVLDWYDPTEAIPTPLVSSPSASLTGPPPFSPETPDTVATAAKVDLQSADSRPLVSSSGAAANDTSNPEQAHGNEVRPVRADPGKFFTPYESPLKYFRAYRFHQDFKNEISGGFKSLTYSNKIIADRELCRYELAGGVCNDESCEYQHFKDMGLADDTILVELGDCAGYSEEDKPKFVSGLRTVLQGLRNRKVKDFQTIAAEIAAYRARFLGDSSRVLLLDVHPPLPGMHFYFLAN